MNNKNKKMVAPILITILMLIYYLAYFGFLISLVNGIWKILLAIIPIFFCFVMIYVCKERIQEIKKGEEDDLSQY